MDVRDRQLLVDPVPVERSMPLHDSAASTATSVRNEPEPSESAFEAGAASLPQRWRDRVLLDTLRGMFRHRLLCVVGVFLATAAGGLSTLLLEPFYIARASIYPLTTTNPLSGLGIPGVAGLAGTLGLAPGTSSQFPIYEKVLFSRQLIQELLQTSLADAGLTGTLLDHLQLEDPDPALRSHFATEAVRARLTYEVDPKTGIATISFRDADPKLAALLANRAVDLLNGFDISTSANQAHEKRIFVEGRMQESAQSLAAAEKRFETFRQQNMRIGNAPDLLLEQARLQREVEIEQQVYLTLRKEVELSRIEEHRSVPVVNVLERATPPVFPAGPLPVRNALLAGFLGTVLVIGIFVLQAIGPRRMLAQLTRLRD